MKKMAFALAAIAVATCAAEVEPFRKKVIMCSWDNGVFSVADVLSNKAAFAALPIDGMRIPANGLKLPDGKPLNPWQAFSGTNEWPEGILDPLVPQFREAVAIPTLRHSFTGFLMARGNRKTRLDFRDDAGWARAFSNVRQLAVLARKGGLRGLIMDPEDYGKSLQFYKQEEDPPYEETARLARQRGREFARTVMGAYPEMTLFVFWAFSHGRQYMVQLDPAAAMRAKGELYIPFLDGVLDAIPPGARIVDGDEPSYNYSARGGGELTYAIKACDNRACVALVSPENQEKFRTQVLMGFAIYLDRYTNKKGNFYYTGPLSGSRLHQFDENLTGALRATDEYVWLYGEKFAMIDWRVHGKPTRAIRFAEHRTWDDEVPGLYDAVWAARNPRDFLDRRFPEIRGKGACTNLVKFGVMKVTGKFKHGRQVFRKPVRRGERYVVEFVAKGPGANGGVGFYKEDLQRQWGLPGLTAKGEGLHRLLVKVGPDTGFVNLGMSTSAGEDAEVEFSDIGFYRLPAPMEPEEDEKKVEEQKKEQQKEGQKQENQKKDQKK